MIYASLLGKATYLLIGEEYVRVLDANAVKPTQVGEAVTRDGVSIRKAGEYWIPLPSEGLAYIADAATARVAALQGRTDVYAPVAETMYINQSLHVYPVGAILVDDLLTF